ncbi:helix-turn-helix domain-containing protein, partial [Phenylobacterium sp.]|uniref:helix-turn-helix domain-containing protein n=1 Tax=Phenylobacterium sp. TaxID=1871053 RepID=UPI002FDF83F6
MDAAAHVYALAPGYAAPPGVAAPPSPAFDTDAWVGGEIRRRRKARGLSQSALAAAIGVTFQQVQKYERGANRVSASTLWRVAQALRCEPGAFFPGYPALGGPDPDGLGPVGRAFLASDGGLALARAWLALTPDRRAALLAAARALAQARP